MYMKLATNIGRLGGSRMTLFGKRFFSDAASYDRCYKLIDQNHHRNTVFWSEIKDAVKTVEHAEKNKTSLAYKDLENIWDIKYSLSRTYDNPALYEDFEPLFSTLNKADGMLNKGPGFSNT